MCYESETNGSCSNHLLIVKLLNVRHDSQSQGSSVHIWWSVRRIWIQWFLQQPFSYSELSQCCPRQPTHMIIGTDLKRPASNLKPTISAATIFLKEKHVNVVHDTKSLWSSVLIWRGLLLIWNLQYLQQPFSYGEASQCFPWHPKPRIIGTDLKRSASNLKPTVSATTISWSWSVSVLSMTANA